MSSFTKGIFIVIAVVACLVIGGISINGTRKAKSSYDQKQAQLDSLTSNFVDADLAYYDGATVLGSTLRDDITELDRNSTPVAIKVITNADENGKFYCNTYTGDNLTKITSEAELTDTITAADYINPSGYFMGSVTKSKNGNIVLITFTQQ